MKKQRAQMRRIWTLVGVLAMVLVVALYASLKVVAWRHHMSRLRQYSEVVPPRGTSLTSRASFATFLSVPVAEIFDYGWQFSGPRPFNLGPVNYSFVWFEARVNDNVSGTNAFAVLTGKMRSEGWSEIITETSNDPDFGWISALGSDGILLQQAFWSPGETVIAGITAVVQLRRRATHEYIRVLGQRWNYP